MEDMAGWHGKAPNDEEYAIAVRKGNTEFLNQVNASLRKLKESGKFQEIVDKYISAE